VIRFNIGWLNIFIWSW